MSSVEFLTILIRSTTDLTGLIGGPGPSYKRQFSPKALEGLAESSSAPEFASSSRPPFVRTRALETSDRSHCCCQLACRRIPAQLRSTHPGLLSILTNYGRQELSEICVRWPTYRVASHGAPAADVPPLPCQSPPTW